MIGNKGISQYLVVPVSTGTEACRVGKQWRGYAIILIEFVYCSSIFSAISHFYQVGSFLPAGVTIIVDNGLAPCAAPGCNNQYAVSAPDTVNSRARCIL